MVQFQAGARGFPALARGVKRLEREVDHLPSTSAKFTSAGTCISIPPYAFMG